MSARGEALIERYPERTQFCRCQHPGIDHHHRVDAGGHLIGGCRVCRAPDLVCERFEAVRDDRSAR